MTKIKSGSNAIDFSLPGTDGLTYSLKSFEGKAGLAIIFWCNHCPYALAWEERVLNLARKFGEKGFDFVLICANESKRYPADSFEKMKEHAQEKHYPMPYLHDETQMTARNYGAQHTPEVFLFDAERRLVYHGAPDDNFDNPDDVVEAYLENAIGAVLAKKPVAIADTPAIGCTIKWK